MSTLQVKNLPDPLHAELRRRASAEGTTISELVTRMLRRELSRPSQADWLALLQTVPGHAQVDTVGALEAARDERD